VLKNLLGKINLFAKLKAFIAANPQRAKFIGVIALTVIIPLTVLAALTIQNLKQHAGGGTMVSISDKNRNTIFSTPDTNVFVDINLNSDPNWMIPGPGVGINNLITKAYAAVTCDEFGNCTDDSAAPAEPATSCTKTGNTCTDINGAHQDTCILNNATEYFCGSQNLCVTATFSCPAGTVCTLNPATTHVDCVNSASVISATPIPLRETPAPLKATPTPARGYHTPIPTSIPISSPPHTPNVLRAVYIENKDTDGSTGGSAPVKIPVNNISDIDHIPWRLNDLLPGQTQAPRTVQVTLIGDSSISAFATVINLNPDNVPVSFTVPLRNVRSADLNNDGKIDCKDTKILMNNYGERGTNIPDDLNRDGVVNEIDYNAALRSYTPGDTTVCN